VHLPLVGAHNIYNALAAVAVALERGITLADAAKVLASLVPSDKRGQVVKVDKHYRHQRLLQFQS
jgi:UDP-N-acetylmuramoyl-tripeptide--D-alanyl-D-alanine ligase